MADKYDIPFFSRLLKSTILDLAKCWYPGALVSYAIAYRLGHLDLVRETLRLVSRDETPLELSLSEIDIMGFQAWRALVIAYDRSTYTRHGFSACAYGGQNEVVGIQRWPCNNSGWAKIADNISLRWVLKRRPKGRSSNHLLIKTSAGHFFQL
jgi:hypothetical protein